MRAVIDTNVLLSGLLWRGPPHDILSHVRDGRLTLILSPALLAEFAGVISRPKFHTILARAAVSGEILTATLAQLAEITDPPPLPRPICRDPDDDAVLALAIAASADLIITGDDDLLTLTSHEDIPITDAATALAIIKAT